MNDSFLFLVLGPSGVGKTTLIDSMLDIHKNLEFIPSYTTRKPRENEINGKDYFFVDNPKFKSMITQNLFLEYDQPFKDRYYGIPKKEILDSLTKGVSVIRTIAPNGLKQVLKLNEIKTLSILLSPDDNYNIKDTLMNRDGTIDKNRFLFELDESIIDHRIISVFGNPEFAIKEVNKIIAKYLK